MLAHGRKTIFDVRFGLLAVLCGTLAACGARTRAPSTPAPTVAKENKLKKFFRDAGDLVQIRATAGAGFSGIRVAEVVESPAYTMMPKCATCTDSVAVLRADSIDLVPNKRYSWKPALSTGLSANIYSNRASHAGIGVGAHIVFVPDAEGHTSAFPAATLHLGSPQMEVFFGAVFSPSDNVVLPAGLSRVRTALAGPRPNFVQPATGKTRTLYMGIQVAGVRLSGSEVAPGADMSNVPPVASARIAPDTIRVKVGEETTATAQFFDAGQSTLTGRTGFFVVKDPKLASVQAERAEKVRVKGIAKGTTMLRLQRDALYSEVPLIVTE